MNSTKNNLAPEYNRATIDLYNLFLSFQENGKNHTKSELVRELAESQKRSTSEIECRLSKISAIRKNILGLPIVKNYKPLFLVESSNGHDLARMICNDLGVEYEG